MRFDCQVCTTLPQDCLLTGRDRQRDTGRRQASGRAGEMDVRDHMARAVWRNKVKSSSLHLGTKKHSEHRERREERPSPYTVPTEETDGGRRRTQGKRDSPVWTPAALRRRVAMVTG